MAEKKGIVRNNLTMTDGLSLEDEILIHCARINLSPVRCEALKNLLAKEPDWELLLEKSTWHRLSCLVSHHLRSADLSTFVPQLVSQKAQNILYLSMARNILLQNELSQLLSAFNREGIPIIVLKGAALLGSIYKDISLRPMGDLDILVSIEHLDRAETIALCQGYSHVHNSRSQDRARKELRHLATMFNREKRIILEIHQHIEDLDSPHLFELRSFWTRAQRFTILNANALILAPEDLLIHLGLNFFRDRRDSSNSALGQLCDISEVISHFGDSLNWDLIERAAKEYGIASTLHCAFYICEQLLGTQVPASMLSHLQPLEFNPSMVTLFIHRRLLCTKNWVRLDWMAPKRKYSRYGILPAIINKLIHIPLKISQEQESRGQKISYYFWLMKNMIPALARELLRPTDLKQDLLLDHWLHDINSSTTKISPNHNRH